MFKLSLFVLGLISLVILTSCQKSFSARNKQLAIGQKAPNFNLLDDAGKNCKLSDYLGKKVVLYFYPKDNTPNCTQQACSLRDANDIYTENNIVVLGVNYDSVASHQAFKAKNHLKFKLLSDTNRSVAKLYGANTGVKNYLFPKRITFLINEQGVIVKIFKEVDVMHHAQEILKAFRN